MVRSHWSSVMSAAGPVGQRDAGVVEGDVEAAEGVGGSLQRVGDVLVVGDVASDSERGAAVLLDRLDGAAAVLGGEVGDDDRGAFTREGDGGGAADAVGGAGHEADLPGEPSCQCGVHGVSRLLSSRAGNPPVAIGPHVSMVRRSRHLPCSTMALR